MERRNYVTRGIDAIAKSLTKLWADLRGIKGQGRTAEIQELISLALEKMLNLSFSAFLDTPVGFVIQTLQAQNCDSAYFEDWADIFLFWADELCIENPFNPDSFMIYGKCLEIYEHLNVYNSTYSYSIHLKIERIKKIRIVGK